MCLNYASIIKDLQNHTAFAVYLILLDLVDKSGTDDQMVTISHRKIGSLINVSVRTSIRAIRCLKRKGYIETTDKRYQPNEIRVKIIRE